MSISLYAHNQTTYENMCLLFQCENRVAVVQPTGTGKSFLYLKWIEDHPEQRILVISPSHYIFQQLEKYGEQSELSVENVSYMTYARLAKLSEEELGELQIDFLVLDEFHRCGAPEWGRGVQVLLKRYDKLKVLGTSATPIRYLDSCRNMAQEVFHDTYAVHMGIAEALAQKILPTPIYVASLYSFVGELEALQDRAQATSNERLRLQLFNKIKKAKRMLNDKEYTLESIFKKHISNPTGRYIVFCSNEERMKEAMGKCQEWFIHLDVAVHKYQVLSTYKNSKEEFQAFEQDNSANAMKLLFCVDMLNEGVHVEGIEGVIMLRSTESLNVYYQQLGRALTCMGDSKKRPLIFDLVNNFENGNACSMNEEVLYQLCAEMDANEMEIDFELHDYIVDLRIALENVKNTFEKSWEYNYESVKAFQSEYDRFPYNKEQYHGVDLGSWCIVQRRQYQNGSLSEERIELLECIGFQWKPREDAWTMRYEELRIYIEETGSLPKSREHASLYQWLAKQRKLYKIGQLEIEKERLLLKLCVVLGTNTSEQIWSQRVTQLETFIALHHRTPQSGEEQDGVQIGMWLVEQRSMERSGKLLPERKKILETKGIIFQERKDRAFWDNLEQLKAFANEYQRFPNTTEKYRDFGLGVWCSRIREDYKVGKLNIEQIEALQEIGFDLRSTNEIRQEQRWEQYYIGVKTFIEANGRLPKGRENQNLYWWIKKQRQVQESGKLTRAQVERLREIAVVR